MDDDSKIDWTVTTFDGNRAVQQREFQALSAREEVLALEEMQRVADAVLQQEPKQAK